MFCKISSEKPYLIDGFITFINACVLVFALNLLNLLALLTEIIYISRHRVRKDYDRCFIISPSPDSCFQHVIVKQQNYKSNNQTSSS